MAPSPVSSRASAIFATTCGLLASACGSAGSRYQDPGAPAVEDAGGSAADAGGQEDAAPPRLDGGTHGDAGLLADAGTHADSGAPVEAGPGNPCPALTFPSGVKIQTFEDAAMTATYANHLGTGEKAPTCFLDVNNLVDPDTGTVQALTVNVAAHFTLDELVGTEVAQGYGNLVVMEPAAVESLEKLRESLNVPVSVNSGFRGPKHQEAVCNSLCGNPLGCPGTCANNSRHMFGDAFDLPLEFYTMSDEQLACTVGFKFAYLESGTHLHIDQNPAYATCVTE